MLLYLESFHISKLYQLNVLFVVSLERADFLELQTLSAPRAALKIELRGSVFFLDLGPRPVRFFFRPEKFSVFFKKTILPYCILSSKSGAFLACVLFSGHI